MTALRSFAAVAIIIAGALTQRLEIIIIGLALAGLGLAQLVDEELDRTDDPAERSIARSREQYLAGNIDAEQFETRVEQALNVWRGYSIR